MLGGDFEAGKELSVGQWQKIRDARAFMSDAEVVILDRAEHTSLALRSSRGEHRAVAGVFRPWRVRPNGRILTAPMSPRRMAESIVSCAAAARRAGLAAELLARDGAPPNVRLQPRRYLGRTRVVQLPPTMPLDGVWSVMQGVSGEGRRGGRGGGSTITDRRGRCLG